jgi:hypothetical protein
VRDTRSIVAEETTIAPLAAEGQTCMRSDRRRDKDGAQLCTMNIAQALTIAVSPGRRPALDVILYLAAGDGEKAQSH